VKAIRRSPSGLELCLGKPQPITPEGLAHWVLAVCEVWANPWGFDYVEDYWRAVDFGGEVEVPEAALAIPVSSGEFDGELVFDTSGRGSVWLSDEHGTGIELLGLPRPPRPRASPEQVARFMAEFDIRPLENPPNLRPEHPQLGRQPVGSCVLCGRDVAAFAMKWTGWAVDGSALLVHGECFKEAVDPEDQAEPARARASETESERRYRSDLRGLRTATLGSIIFAFEDAPESERLEHAWRIRIVREEFATRMASKREGDVIEVDERLAGAAARLDEREWA